MSPNRREWIQAAWGKGYAVEELDKRIQQAQQEASQHGHNLGPFVWSQAFAGSLIHARCRQCGSFVYVKGAEISGTVLTRPCLTHAERDDIQQHKRLQKAEKQQWQKERLAWLDGRRAMTHIRKVLRNQSNSQIAVFKQALTSPR